MKPHTEGWGWSDELQRFEMGLELVLETRLTPASLQVSKDWAQGSSARRSQWERLKVRQRASHVSGCQSGTGISTHVALVQARIILTFICTFWFRISGSDSDLKRKVYNGYKNKTIHVWFGPPMRSHADKPDQNRH
jgi:hypothetical protein